MNPKKSKSSLRVFIDKFFDIPFGQIGFSSFIIAAVSGIFLAIPFDIKNPYDSISLILLTNQYASFFRNIHYWSAQTFLVFTVLHTIDHFIRNTEKKLNNGVWLRITLSIFFVFFVMISGFILKGDADSEQALRILRSLFEQIPFVGNLIAGSLLEREGDYQLIYVHHIVTATIILWIVIVEHSKILWAEIKAFIYTLIAISFFSFLFIASLHDGKSPIIKGPWYFVGLQEILHWISQTQVVIIFIAIISIIFYLTKNLRENYSSLAKRSFLIMLFVYLTLTAIGYYFRGENWEFILPWKDSCAEGSSFRPMFNFSDLKDEEFSPMKFKQILGRREGCVVCHQMTGLSTSHAPEVIGCYSCHLGNAFTLNKDAAHKSMILIPGNLSDAKYTCGTAACHPDIVPRINNNIMSTMSGVVSVNRFVFDESVSPSVLSHVKDLGSSDPDSHLRNLCASCHLGNEKIELGPINELSRGGGCNACHLNYSEDAKDQLNDYLKSDDKTKYFPKVHPDLNLQISNDHCFGCHSRSGRVATNYEGWFETLKSDKDIVNKSDYRVLMDGRVFQKTEADIHFQKRMDCIDCHLAQEVMGDGNLYLHKEDQIKVQCVDCHSYQTENRVAYDQLDYESRKIVDLRNAKMENSNFLVTEKSNIPLTNSYINSSNQKYLMTKTKKDSLSLKPPAFVCTAGKVHQRISCNSCHTERVSYCIGCHTEYNSQEDGFDLLDNQEIKGSWSEHASDFYIDYPVLGIRSDKVAGKETIETFIPGMIISIEKMKNQKDKKIFKRLFAPTFSHTINKKGRSCKSCHNNSLALGYGKGKLVYKIEEGHKQRQAELVSASSVKNVHKIPKQVRDDISGNKQNTGRWNFKPYFSLLPQDNLPKDAWIGFLQTRNETSTTRRNTRPFTIDEQKRILLVGACLTCHDENSKIMNVSLYDFEKLLKQISNKCVLPD